MATRGWEKLKTFHGVLIGEKFYHKGVIRILVEEGRRGERWRRREGERLVWVAVLGVGTVGREGQGSGIFFWAW